MTPRLPGIWFYTVALIVLLAMSAMAVPPTEEAVAKWKAAGIFDQKIANLREFRALGGNAPSKHSPLATLREARTLSLNANTVDTLWVCVILVEFTDWPASGGNVFASRDDFQTLLFSQTGVDTAVNPTGSMTDFYLENSYDEVMVLGDVYGWYRMPNTYASYVGTNDGLGGGGALLAGHAIDSAINDGVDFSKYANGDAMVDGVVVVHAGAGAETGAYGIWSHMGSTITRIVDGIYISEYTMNPEEYGAGISTMGVFAHEWGHVLGLPDVYDTGDGPGAGLGRWSLMAGGSWNGSPGGATPAHIDAWCKMILGLVSPIWLDENITQAPIPDIKDSGVVYALGANPGMGNLDYWLVENRRKTGFDSFLPGGGLLVYHVEIGGPPSQNSSLYDHYWLSIEQADGEDDLYNNGSSDGGDPFPGSTNNRNFHTYTSPNSLTWDGEPSEVGIWNISNPGPVMYADLDIEYSHPWVLFAEHPDSIEFVDAAPNGNGNGIPEAGETVEAYFMVRNKMAYSFDPTFTLSVDAEGVTFSQNSVALHSPILGNTFNSYNDIPIIFSLSEDFGAFNATFNLEIISHAVSGAYDSSYSSVLEFERQLGRTQVFLVDDDNGGSSDVKIKSILDRLKIPYGYHNKTTSGTPTIEQISGYQTLIWFTGLNQGTTSQMTPNDVALMKVWLDGGNSLFLTSLKAAGQLDALDQSFLNTYLHTTFDAGGAFGLGYVGDDGNEITAGTQYGILSTAAMDPSQMEIIEPFGGGLAALHLNPDDLGGAQNIGVCGVSYSGAYRTFFTTMGLEYIGDGTPALGVQPVDTLVKRVLTFFRQGTATAVEGDSNPGLLPNRFALDQNYPNPFNPTTMISYTVGANDSGRPVHTRLVVYNALGQQVKTLVDQVQNPGDYSVSWDGSSDGGSKVSTGVYLYRLEQGDRSQTRKMVLLK